MNIQEMRQKVEDALNLRPPFPEGFNGIGNGTDGSIYILVLNEEARVKAQTILDKIPDVKYTIRVTGGFWA